MKMTATIEAMDFSWLLMNQVWGRYGVAMRRLCPYPVPGIATSLQHTHIRAGRFPVMKGYC